MKLPASVDETVSRFAEMDGRGDSGDGDTSSP